MPLAGGTRLGVFEILAPLGAGGRRDVCRANEGPFQHRTLAVSPDEEWALFGESPAAQYPA